jgi:hypothetical protein
MTTSTRDLTLPGARLPAASAGVRSLERGQRATMALWLLRVGVAMCFIGHGAFGIITKAAWVPYFAVIGIPEAWAWRLMPWVGTMDVTIGFLALIWPCRALFVWAATWATWTALLRPLAGQGWPEFFERAGNYGVSLSILAIVGLSAHWLARLPDDWQGLSERVHARVTLVLRLATASLLAGHAACAVVLRKESLASHYSPLFPGRETEVMLWVGYFEFGLAALVLTTSIPALLVVVAGWKLLTEALFLTSGSTAAMFEVIERGGSYLVPLALAVLLWPGSPDVGRREEEPELTPARA